MAYDKPAIAGGNPAKTVPYTRSSRFGDEELQHLKEALDQQTLFYAAGKKVYGFEALMAEMHGVPHAVSCTSGTAGIHAATMALGISPGDEVIVTPITDMGSIIPILFQGGIPVFADVDPHNYCITPESVAAVITEKTRAVIAVHLWGNACDMYGLKALCDSKGIALIEDCAQAWGCTYDGKPIGTIGDIGCFSVNDFKHISCGDGGIVISSNSELATKARMSTDKSYSRVPGASRNPYFLAANYRMTELQGAVGIAQLPKLANIVSKRRAWCEALTDAISGFKGIDVPVPTDKCNPSWWFYMMRVDASKLGADVDEMAEALAKEGICAGAHYLNEPVYNYPIFTEHSAFDHADHPFNVREYHMGLCPVTEDVLNTCLLISVNEGYTQQDLEETIEGMSKCVRYFNDRL